MKTSTMLMVCALFAVVACAGASNDDRPCQHTRADAHACALKYGDSNGDGRISREEIDNLRSRSLHYWETAISWIAGKNADAILNDCDVNGDGYLDADDFNQSADACLATCKDITDFFYYVCDRNPTLP